MTAPLRFGQIVWAELADANGIRKMRPAVIVTPDDQIPTADSLEVVAVTSWLPRRLPDDHVLLPWHPRGHPRTGLNRKCAAVCTWLARQVALPLVPQGCPRGGHTDREPWEMRRPYRPPAAPTRPLPTCLPADGTFTLLPV
jgi:hypothetical protein